MTDPERVLFVHAHPDDESIATGGTIALLTASGSAVTVLTCTRGELGEVVDPALAISGPAELALAREREIAAALAILGVTDHRFLGAPEARWEGSDPRVYLDSGMQWGSRGAEPLDEASAESLSSAPLSEIAADIATVIADVLPDAVVSYDARGGYGHPDHIRAAEAARRAAEVMGVPYWAIVPDAGDAGVTVDVASVVRLKRAALLEYRSQLTVGEDWFAGANGEREPITTVEGFERAGRDPVVDNSYAAQSLALKVFTLAASVLLGAAAGVVFAVAAPSSGWVVAAGIVAGVALVLGLRMAFRSRTVPLVAAAGFVIAEILLVAVSGGFIDPGVARLVFGIGTIVVVLAGFVGSQVRLLGGR